MKNYILPLALLTACLVSTCRKEHNGNGPASVIPQIIIQSINYPSCVGSNWTPVTGGTVHLQFDQVNGNGTVLSTTKDSISLANIINYDKELPKGTYNINYSVGNSSVADTFVRFNGQIIAYQVDSKQSLVLNSGSSDGLITLGKNFIKDGTIPTFKPDAGTASFKLGLKDSYYYLYIKGGVTGSINFIAKTTDQTVSKKLSITALNQLNMAVVIDKGSLQVTFVPFVSNPVAVNSGTLVVLNVYPKLLARNISTWFVATDESGNVLSETKYIPGSTLVKLNVVQYFSKDRFNLFEVYSRTNDTLRVTGYLQVKKGSTFAIDFPGKRYLRNNLVQVHLKNSPAFDQFSASTNYGGTLIHTLQDSSSLQFGYLDTTRLWAQVSRNNQHYYNLFSIAKGTTNFNLDISQLNKTPLKTTMTAPGNNITALVVAKTDQRLGNGYNFGQTSSSSGSVDYYYPVESFKYYETSIKYTVGNYDYRMFTSGPVIDGQARLINAGFTVSGSTLANFVPNITGTYDYYHASFTYSGNGPHLQTELYSPAAANYTNIKMPDFSKYLGLQSLDLANQKLSNFEVIKANVFDENKFTYDIENGGFTQTVDCRAIAKKY